MILPIKLLSFVSSTFSVIVIVIARISFYFKLLHPCFLAHMPPFSGQTEIAVHMLN
nr:MAG TPA: hypothetical protein [Caudoviricetes sp.]